MGPVISRRKYTVKVRKNQRRICVKSYERQFRALAVRIILIIPDLRYLNVDGLRLMCQDQCIAVLLKGISIIKIQWI